MGRLRLVFFSTRTMLMGSTLGTSASASLSHGSAASLSACDARRLEPMAPSARDGDADTAEATVTAGTVSSSTAGRTESADVAGVAVTVVQAEAFEGPGVPCARG